MSVIGEKLQRHSVDTALLTTIVVLVGVGIVSLFSSSYWRAELVFDDPHYFFRRRLVWAGLGGVVVYFLSRIEMKYVEKSIPWMVLVTIVLLLLTFVDGIGASYLGARRWLSVFGISFQPSEAAKLTLILYLSLVLDRKADRIDEPWNAFVPPLIIVSLFSALVYMQNDFSTAVFLLILSIIMFFIGGIRVRYFVITLISALPIGLTLLLSREHRVERVISFLFPTLDPQGSGYQLLAAHSALQKGGWLGTGMGLGSYKLGELPEAHSDFIFAVIAEETGLIGTLAIILLFVFFAVQGIRIASQSQTRFGSFLATGITVAIVLQALFNIAVICGLIPTTGITLPFFSAGGSSMLITMVMCGLLLNISRLSKGGTYSD